LGIEEAFSEVERIKSTVVDYSGGWFNNATYRDVCTGKTGHTEAVQVQFDPNKVSCENLLDVFWSFIIPQSKTEGF
jgi:peptide-methionine (S)-S-oxide reductase